MKLTTYACRLTGVLVLLSLTSAGVTPASFADDVVLGAAKDNTLINDCRAEPDCFQEGEVSNGAGPNVFSGVTGQLGPGALRGILAFDVAGNIPAGSSITDVQLTLVVSNSNDDMARSHSLHAVTRDWGEGSSVAVGGSGAPATPNDATWLFNFFGTSSWATPGGDFRSSASATQVVPGGGFESVGSPVTWGSTADLVSDVQGWLDDPSSNYGWVLIGDDETTERTARGFHSRESVTDMPQLSISFTPVPEPVGGAAMIASCFIGLLSRRRLYS